MIIQPYHFTLLWISLVVIPLSACQGSPEQEISRFVKSIQQNLPSSIDDLVLPSGVKKVLYQGGDADPFNSEQSKRIEKPLQNWPDKNNALESFSLDALSLVGVFEKEKKRWGIIRDHNGQLYAVSVGHYIGMNRGKIEKITLEQIEVREEMMDIDRKNSKSVVMVVSPSGAVR